VTGSDMVLTAAHISATKKCHTSAQISTDKVMMRCLDHI